MKIAMITSSLAKRGQTRIVYELVEEYIKNGIDITVYYFDEKKGFLFSCETKIISFFQTINFDNYDIVHTHGIRPDAYVYFHNKNIKKAKTVTTLHSYIKKSLKNRYNTIISLIFSYLWNISTIRHNAVVVLSQDAKKYYSVFWKNKNLYVIYNGISKYISVSNNIPNKKNHIHIGAVGLITTIKGFEQLIKVLVEDKNIFLSLVGDGKEEESLRELATNLGVENQVDFLGFQKDVGKYLKDMDIYIIPSRSEGFPVSLLEAASIKKGFLLKKCG